MGNLTKRDLVIQISNETGYVQQEVSVILQKAFDIIVDALAGGRSVQLRGIFVLFLQACKKRIGRNPNRPEKDILIPERVVVKFKPGKEMKARVSKLSPEQIEQVALSAEDDDI